MRCWGPIKAANKIKILEITYMVTIAFLLSAVALTPVLIRHHFLLFKKYVIQEDAVEVLLISLLLLIAYLLSNFYKKEMKKLRRETSRLFRDNCDLSDKLSDAFKYIGGVNVQIQEIRSILCGPRKYPATESEFRKSLALFACKILGIVNADWVVIRIVSQDNLRTLKEHLEPRQNAVSFFKGISNKAIVANQAIDGYSLVASRHDNSMTKVACVFPKKSLDEEEKILVEAITNQIEMLYLIYVSRQLHELYLKRKPIPRIQQN
jgi:hypothetical protein